MNVTTSYPGVYLSEDAVPIFSVNNANTAVPVFAYTNKSKEKSENIHCYYTWKEFLAKNPNTEKFIQQSKKLYFSLKLWFMHGGGKCYLASKDQIEDLVKKHDDITLVIESGIEVSIYDEFNSLVNKGHRIFGLFDGPIKQIDAGKSQEDVMKLYPTSSYGAVFYPWGKMTTGEDVPPSAIAAAAIAQTDRNRGVWKAPANQAINGVIPKYPVSDDFQGRFNEGKALNMIRNFPEVGTVIWGARTLEDSDKWRYIPVRRLFNSVELDIQKSLNKMVFEPNNQPTWQRVKASVNNYFHALWKQGGLAGNNASESWFVQVGKDITMTQEQIDKGQMIIKIGLAAVRPAEFIILQFSQNIAQ